MVDFIPVAVRNLFHRPATRNYPFVRRAPYAGARGHIDMEINGCIFCGLCARRCPVGALEVSRPQKTWSINRFRCIVCGDCVRTCPKKCLSMGAAYTAPAPQKSVDTFHPQEEPAEKPHA